MDACPSRKAEGRAGPFPYIIKGLEDGGETYSADPVSVTVEIIDSGAPYDPLAKPDAATADEFDSVADIPIGGLGILMAKNSVDDMTYERTDDQNIVTIVKRW